MNDLEESLDLGACCACGKRGPAVRCVLLLPHKAPVPGTGWGCVQCGLACDGAVAVLCDVCLYEERPVREACFGHPAAGERVPLSSLAGWHEHDLEKHSESMRKCRVCGCHDGTACVSEEHGPCWWVADDLCSHCAMECAGGLPA